MRRAGRGGVFVCHGALRSCLIQGHRHRRAAYVECFKFLSVVVVAAAAAVAPATTMPLLLLLLLLLSV